MTDNLTPESGENADRPSGAAPAPQTPPSREPNWERAVLERVALAAVREQRAARRWRIFFRFAFLFVLALVAFALFDVPGEKVAVAGRHTALVRIDGEIASDKNANAEDVATSLRRAFEDTDTAGVVLQINSPGGSPV